MFLQVPELTLLYSLDEKKKRSIFFSENKAGFDINSVTMHQYKINPV